MLKTVAKISLGNFLVDIRYIYELFTVSFKILCDHFEHLKVNIKYMYSNNMSCFLLYKKFKKMNIYICFYAQIYMQKL